MVTYHIFQPWWENGILTYSQVPKSVSKVEANSNTKKAAESVTPVDKSKAQPSTKKNEPEVLILTFNLDLFDCESIYIVKNPVFFFLVCV